MKRSAISCRLLAAAAIGGLAGCAPRSRLSFPTQPARTDEHARYYDTDRDGRVDFAVHAGPDGLDEVLAYDDDEDGDYERSYRLSDYEPQRVPHLIILLDSIPYTAVARAHAQGRLSCFRAPQKVIPPFPTMSGLIFSQIVGAPPTPGMINRHYDRRRGRMDNRIVKRVFGWRYPWQLRLHYHAGYWENGLMFLDPRAWYPVELVRIRKTIDESPDRITIVYVASTSGLLSKYGAESLDEILDGLQQLTLQLVHERQGAINVSLISDHGHNLVRPRRISLDDPLKAAGFRPAPRIDGDRDVVYDIDGLVGYIGLHTRQPAAVAEALLRLEGVELALYQQGERVIVRSAAGAAAVEKRGPRYRYEPLDADVLGYSGVVEAMRGGGAMDEAGLADDGAWFGATLDHQWPDAPCRIWDAFHGEALNTPELMITLREGYCIGLETFDLFIDMASTHGGLSQADSATFVMSMTDRANRPMRSRDLMRQLEPEYDP